MNALSNEQVVNYLKQNPDFLLRNPDLLPKPDKRIVQAANSNVVNFSDLQVDRLKSEVALLKAQNHEFRRTGRENTLSLTRVEKSILTLLSSRSLTDAIQVICTTFAEHMGCDWSVLALECEKTDIAYIKRNGLYRLTSGSVDRIMGQEDVRLAANATFESLVFGKNAANVSSACLIQLAIPVHNANGDHVGDVKGILGFGSKEQGTYSETQGKRIVQFLGQSVSQVLSTWMPKRQTSDQRVA